jgi:hypothetical protein
VRIVYTNLKENDAGVKRSVRQFRVEFNGTGALSPTGERTAKPVVLDPGERSEADGRQEAQSREAANGCAWPQTTLPPGSAAGLRRIFINKFVDAMRAANLPAGKKAKISIIV